MTYYGSKEIAASFRTVRANTITVAEEIPEDKYNFRATPDTRSVAETLAHIALSTRMSLEIHGVRKLTSFVGFDFMAVFNPILAEMEKPRTKAQLLDLLKTEGEKFAQFLDGLSEEALALVVTFPEGAQPPAKSRFEMLIAPKEHEMHHRSQLMLIERMLGITPHLTRQMMKRMQEMQAAQAAAKS